MDAKARYDKRMKLQRALSRIMERLAGNMAEGIPPDRTTALLMWQVIGKLFPFIKAAGLEPEDLPTTSDLARVLYLKEARQRESHARKLRKLRSRARQGQRMAPRP
jgi:hypothetical protein